MKRKYDDDFRRNAVQKVLDRQSVLIEGGVFENVEQARSEVFSNTDLHIYEADTIDKHRLVHQAI